MNNDSIINPNNNDIKTHLQVCCSGLDGFIPMRSFDEKQSTQGRVRDKRWRYVNNIWLSSRNNDDNILSQQAYKFAKNAYQYGKGCYFIPGSVERKGEAKQAEIKQMQTLLIDIDDGDIKQKSRLLCKTLGRPTLKIESGGVTKSGQKKMHIYWQLSEVVSGKKLLQLIHLRYQISIKFGGDVHFKSAHQPIRLAGSVYHKNKIPKLAKIIEHNNVKYELDDLVSKMVVIESNFTKRNQNNEMRNAQGSVSSILTKAVESGGSGGQTRFCNLSRVSGFWIRRYHDGLIDEQRMKQEIQDYNLANVKPPWSDERLERMIDDLLKLDNKNQNNQSNKTTQDHPLISSFSLNLFLQDKSKIPDDLIAPRILTQGGLMVFGGAPKVGKSDFLLSLFVHLAAGKEFVGLKPPRPLRIFYLQAEIGYHYLRERLHNIKLPEDLLQLAKDNLHMTPDIKLVLNDSGVQALIEHVNQVMQGNKPDIIAIDPIRNVFDGCRENDNDSMLFFLQQRIEKLRRQINPEAGVILVHHTKKLGISQLEEDPFQAFSGASSLRGYYSTGAILYNAEQNQQHKKKLVFELRNGSNLAAKILSKTRKGWMIIPKKNQEEGHE
ncbi:MAG: hypothetical protein DGJ47_000342 [Rickettsiaceae bacterium]